MLCTRLTPVHVPAESTPSHISFSLVRSSEECLNPNSAHSYIALCNCRLGACSSMIGIYCAECLLPPAWHFCCLTLAGSTQRMSATCMACMHTLTRPTLRSATKAMCSCPQPPDAAPDNEIGMLWLLCKKLFWPKAEKIYFILPCSSRSPTNSSKSILRPRTARWSALPCFIAGKMFGRRS